MTRQRQGNIETSRSFAVLDRYTSVTSVTSSCVCARECSAYQQCKSPSKNNLMKGLSMNW